jgi:hypothetical protein
MPKFFEKMDALPVIRLLQVAAVITLISGLLQLTEAWLPTFNKTFGPNLGSIANSIKISGMMLGRIIFEPMILLGLAELIRRK